MNTGTTVSKQTLSGSVMEEIKRGQANLDELYQKVCEISCRILPPEPCSPSEGCKQPQPPSDIFSAFGFELRIINEQILTIKDIVSRIQNTL